MKNKKNLRIFCLGLLALVLALGFAAYPVQAADWTGDDDGSDWFNQYNWDPNGVPGSGTDVFINNGGWPSISSNGAAAQNLTLGSIDSGYLDIYYGLTVGGGGGGGAMTVGDAGYGEAYVFGGTLNVTGDLTLGNQAGSYGYMENWDAISVGGHMTIGAQGEADFDHYSGSLTVSGNLTVGNGILNVYGGSLYTDNLIVDGSGSSINQMSGEIYANWDYNVYAGTVNHSGGMASASFMTLGGFNPAGATYNLSDWDDESSLTLNTLTVNRYGSFNLSGDPSRSTLTVGWYAQIFGGTINQDGGTANLASLTVDQWDSFTPGVYNLSGGNLNTDNLIVGDSGVGAFNQSGGTVAVAGGLVLGQQSTGSGTYNLQGGDLTVGEWGGSLIVGDAGIGTFVQTGGSLSVNGNLIVGQSSNNLWNSITLGDPNAPGATSTTTVAGDMIVGQGGSGNPTAFAEAKIYQGNTLTVESNLIVGQNSDSWGRFRNQGGSLTVYGNLVVGETSWGSERLDEPGTFNPNVFEQPYYQYYGGFVYDTYTDSATTTVQSNMTVGDAGFGRVVHKLGSIDVWGSLTLGSQSGSRGDYFLNTVVTSDPPLGYPGLPSLYTGSLSVGADMIVGDAGYGRVVQMMGSATVGGSLTLGRQTGSTGKYLFNTATGYEFPVGTHPQLFTGTLTVGDTLTVGGTGTGEFKQGGGTLNVANLEVGNSSGSGTFAIENAAAIINVSQSLTFGANATFTAVSGATITMTGANFYNYSKDPNNVDMTGLQMLFSNNLHMDTFEVAGNDLGAVMAGFTNNFALGTLKVDPGNVQLEDDFDNNLSGGTGDEALYVIALILGDDSILDLHGLHLYCQSFTDLGGEIRNGTIQVVPLPSTLLLLASGLGGLALMGRRRFSRLGK